MSNALGSGFLEKVYENALAHELRKSGLESKQQHPIKVYYDGVVLNIAPLYELVPWKVAKKYWEELLDGKLALGRAWRWPDTFPAVGFDSGRLPCFLKFAIFLNGKTMNTRKAPNENQVRKWLEEGQLSLPPLSFTLRGVKRKYPAGGVFDFEMEARWGDQSAVFAVEYKSVFTPKAFRQTLNQCRVARLPANRYPLVMLPYLRPEQLEELESNGISGVDWCGNGVVIVPDKIRVFRSGGDNQFATYSPIKNIYRKNTSMVPRLLLTAARFTTVQEILAEVNRRNLFVQKADAIAMSMGTVSKALKQLEDDLIVGRNTEIRLLQADKLLEQLQQNYEPPKARPVRLKVDCEFAQLPQLVSTKLERNPTPLVATGLSSVSQYATMQREELLAVYCLEAKRIQAAIGGRETDRFPNLELIETLEQPLYFDAREESGFYWASPVQTWLELIRGDKRDRETAEQVKESILHNVRGDR